MDRKAMLIQFPVEVRFQIEAIARKHYQTYQDVVVDAVKAFYVLEGEPGTQVQKQECQVS